ncbi:MAG: hypothetical protein GWO16_01705 [Gammaproteobacteria bacterium]|nr:hypothetical protein [Gammaproteobacteria bacterium]NIR96849.1 hypothetical protein [Gammaproteobacteria bacterium]NIT62560.1 hypothetical protein [Gammaproteobacteria bacterium]NIV19504.1 hypothetical protein [Gammaproteobacteria bacterium]NIY31140.1 hypothetical protein [Gammaproteobacteria bacterium]
MDGGTFPWTTLIAELAGLAATLVLLIPAFRKSRMARLARLVGRSVSRSEDVEELRREWVRMSDNWKAEWDARDFSYLVAGRMLLLVSFAIKIVGLI